MGVLSFTKNSCELYTISNFGEKMPKTEHQLHEKGPEFARNRDLEADLGGLLSHDEVTYFSMMDHMKQLEMDLQNGHMSSKNTQNTEIFEHITHIAFHENVNTQFKSGILHLVWISLLVRCFDVENVVP